MVIMRQANLKLLLLLDVPIGLPTGLSEIGGDNFGRPGMHGQYHILSKDLAHTASLFVEYVYATACE